MLRENFDKLLALVALLISVGILFGVFFFKASDFYKLAEYAVTSSLSSLTTLLTGKAITNWMGKPGDKPTNVQEESKPQQYRGVSLTQS